MIYNIMYNNYIITNNFTKTVNFSFIEYIILSNNNSVIINSSLENTYSSPKTVNFSFIKYIILSNNNPVIINNSLKNTYSSPKTVNYSFIEEDIYINSQKLIPNSPYKYNFPHKINVNNIKLLILNTIYFSMNYLIPHKTY